jgi:hypothetical protein
MTWLVPSALAIAGVAAAIAVALHFIARSRPLAEPLPTARFIPARPVHARARSIALTDLLLLFVRIAALLAIGLAVAAPAIGGRGGVARIVLLDRSRAVADIDESRDSVRALGATNGLVIPFDSAAIGDDAAHRLDSVTVSSARGSLSAAFARAIRVAASLPPSADSVELVIVSPLAREEIDDATIGIRNAWPGRVRVVPVRAADTLTAAPRVFVRADPNDAVAAGISLMGLSAPDGLVHVMRGSLTADDSLWAQSGGHVLVHWPASETAADWPARSSIDAIGGVTSNSGTMVARFPRVWVLQGTPIARWSDGEIAVRERLTADGCIRDVGVLIDEASDITLHSSFRAFISALLTPCGGARAMGRPTTAMVASIAGTGSLAPTGALRDRGAQASRWSPWLFALGAVLLIGELALRRSVGRTA